MTVTEGKLPIGGSSAFLDTAVVEQAQGWTDRLTLPRPQVLEFPALARDEYVISLLWQIYIEIQIAARRRDDEEAILVLLLS